MIEVEAFVDGAWIPDGRYDAHDVKGGRFAIFAVADPERLRVRASDQTFPPSGFVEIAVGELDARIVLPRASEVAGRVVLDPDSDSSALEVRLVESRSGRDRSRPPAATLQS